LPLSPRSGNLRISAPGDAGAPLNRRLNWEQFKQYRFLLTEHSYILPRILRSYLKLILLKQPVVRGVEFAITYRCQAHCVHCLQTELVCERPELTPSEIGRIASDFYEFGGLNINITGGEPLLRDDLFECIAAASPRKGFVTLASNGLYLSWPLARELKRAGIRMVTISLDGATASSHDAIRGVPGCFDQVLAAARYCREAGMRVFLNTIMTRQNEESGEIYEIIDLVRREGHTCTINLPYAVGAWEGVTDNRLTPEQMKRYWELVHQPGVRWEGDANYLQEGCPAGTEKIYITPYGDLMPCAVIHASFGNLRERRLLELYPEMRSLDVFKKPHGFCLVGGNPTFQKRILDRINAAARDPEDVEGMTEPLKQITHEELSRDSGGRP